MPRNSFLIEDILEKNDSVNNTRTSTTTTTTTEDATLHPFKKRTYSTMNNDTDSNPNSTLTPRAAKHFKHECLSPASSVSCASESDLTSGSAPQSAAYFSSLIEQNQNHNDLILNSLMQHIQQNFNNDPQQQQLLSNYYAMFSQFQDDYLSKRIKQQQQQTNDYSQQVNQFLIAKLLQQQQHQQLLLNKNTTTKPVKIIQNEVSYKLLQKPKPNSISSSPASSSTSSSTELYNSSSNNLSPQSSDDCSSSCIENVSPLDALLQLANSTFINKNNHMSDNCLMDQEQTNNLKKLLQQNGSAAAVFIDESILLNNDLLLQQQLQIEKQQQLNKSSLNTSFESSSSTSKVANVLIPSVNVTNGKRKRKNRTAFTANQIFELEKRFNNQKYLSPHDRDRIAYELQLSTAQVITWFQNRRAKQKRDMEEMKNDVNAAKSCKVLDPDLDVDKVLRIQQHKYNETKQTSSDKNSINDEFDTNDDITNTSDYEEDNQSINESATGEYCTSNTSPNKSSSNISNENLTK